MRHLAGFALVLPVLAACGPAAAPDGFRPLSRDCTAIAGDWQISADDDAAWLGLERAGRGWRWLSIDDAGNGELTLTLRRPLADVQAEVDAFRREHPDDYRAWRASVLGLPADAGSRRAIVHAGPALAFSMASSRIDCDGGWRDGPGRVAIADDGRGADGDGGLVAAVALALDADGALLLRRHVYRETNSGWSFFGQAFFYPSYLRSDWRRLARLPAEMVRTPPTAAELPLPVDPELARRREGLRRDGVARFRDAFPRLLPHDADVSILREKALDPAALALPPDHVRMELAGRYPHDAEEPFLSTLRRLPGVQDIDLKEADLVAGNRRYVRVEFTLVVVPEPTRR